VWAFVPTFLFAFIAILSKFSMDLRRMHGRMRFRTTGINLVHLGYCDLVQVLNGSQADARAHEVSDDRDIAILSKFSMDLRRMRGRMRFRTTGINLVHLGFVLVIAGVIVATSFDISSSAVYGVDELGTKKDMGNGWSMELAEFDVFQNPDGTWTQTAHLNVYKDGKPYCSGATGFTRTTHFDCASKRL